jgi:hypothetical protein
MNFNITTKLSDNIKKLAKVSLFFSHSHFSEKILIRENGMDINVSEVPRNKHKRTNKTQL